MQKKNKIKFGIPWEYLREGAVALLKKAGYRVEVDEHSYRVEIDDPGIECITSKVEELAPLVEKGIFDVGITEKAFILDSRAKVIELVDLNYGYKTWKGAKIVLAVPENSKIKSVKDLAGKKIATWVPQIAREYFKKHKVNVKIEFTNVPAEPKCPSLVDGIIEFVNTGSNLRKYHLKVLDVIMETSPWLITNKKALKNKLKRKKIKNLAKALAKARKIIEEELKFCTPLENSKIDEIDLKILKILCREGRKSFVDIAKEIGLSPVGVKKRVEKLLKQKFLKIQGLLNIEKFYSVSAHINIEADKKTILNLIEKLEKSPLVYHLVKTSGRYNLLVDLLAPNLESIASFVDKEIRREPGVKYIDINIGELPVIPKAWNPPIT
jgi:ATP phosphoribosyltransferase